MATWKKVAVSGSDISQFNNDAGYLTSITAQHAYTTASYDGTNLVAGSSEGALSFASSSGQGLTIAASTGPNTLTFGLSAIPNTSLENSTISGVSLGSNLNDLTVDDATLELNTGTTYNGSAARTISIKDGGVDTDAIADSLGTIGVNSFTGSFSGSFTGDVNINLEDLTQGTGITAFTYDGNSAQTVAIKNADNLTDNVISKWDDGNGQFTDSSLTDNGTAITGTTSIQLTGANSSLTGSFTGSFSGDGSGLSGIASTLTIDADSGGTSTVDLLTQTLDIAGTANEIVTSVSGQTITVALPDDVVIGNDLTITNDTTINGDLTVLGTASFQHETNLQVADRFILLASGSSAAGDGGIVVQQDTQDVGDLFGFDSATLRWAVDSAFNASTSAFTPEAFMSAVLNTAGNDPNGANDPGARYNKKGNMYVASDSEDIWIYS